MYESGENYLETILLLQQRQGFVRSVDVASELGYSKASVSRAMGILKREGYVEMAGSGEITLTELGRQKALEIYERHHLITEYLTRTLGIDFEIASRDACRIEHVISTATFQRIKEIVQS